MAKYLQCTSGIVMFRQSYLLSLLVWQSDSSLSSKFLDLSEVKYFISFNLKL